MKMKIGNGRNVKKDGVTGEGIIFTVGIIFMCLVLVFPISMSHSEQNSADAVEVMATFEEVHLPNDTEASVNEKWSFYDYIGKMFAELIFGEW